MEKISFLEEIYAKTMEARTNNQITPYSVGEKMAVRNYLNSLRHETSEFEVNDLPFERDEEDFIRTLRLAGVKEIIVTDKSTDLLRCLHAFIRLGCTMVGLATITRKEKCYDEIVDFSLEGIRIRL